MPELLAVPILGDILGGIGALGAGLGGASGRRRAAGAGAAGAAGLGEAAAASAPLDLLSFGTAAGTAIPEALGSIVPATGALASGLATEPGLAGAALGAFAPGLDTTAAGLGLSGLGGAGGVGGLGISPQSAGLEGAAYPSGTVGAPAAPASGPVTPALTGGPAPLGGGTGAAGLAGPAGLDAAPTIGPGAGAGSTAPLDLSSTAAAAGPTASAPSTASGGLSGFLANNKGLLTSLGLPLAATAASPLISKFLNPVPQQAALNNLANQEASLANQQQSLSQTLTNPLVTGQLPPQAAAGSLQRGQRRHLVDQGPLCLARPVRLDHGGRRGSQYREPAIGHHLQYRTADGADRPAGDFSGFHRAWIAGSGLFATHERAGRAGHRIAAGHCPHGGRGGAVQCLARHQAGRCGSQRHSVI